MINRSTVFAALLATTLASSCLLAQPFFFRKDIPVGVISGNAVVGDFNGDGRPDLAFTLFEGLAVVLNTGGGNLGKPIRTAGLYGVPAAADFNGDGKDDLVTRDNLLLISNGDGTFLPPRRIVDLAQGSVTAVADFNRDGKPDLLVIGEGCTPTPPPPTCSVRVWLGNGDGTFRPGELLPSRADVVASAVVADFNHDGVIDVAMPSTPIGPLLVLLGKGDGTFGPEIRTPPDTGFALPLFVADFNGDGLPDLAIASGILLGKGDGTFHPSVAYPFSARDLPVLTAADLTGEGKVDLVVGGFNTNAISIYPGKGDGTFLPAVVQPVGWVPHAAAAVDLDGDGRLDLVTMNDESNTVSVLLAKAQGGPAVRRAVSAASDTAIVAPESIATLFAPTTATAGESASPPWPTRLGGISLQVRDSAGVTRQAPLLFVSPTQINFQVPADTALGEAALAVVGDSGSIPIGSMEVDAVAPGLFLMFHFPAVPAATAVRVEADGTQVPVAVFSCSGNSCKAEPITLSAAGGRPIYLSFFATGFRGASPDDVTCSISRVQVPVLYAGPQGTPGLDQINVRLLPETLDDFFRGDVIIRINGVAANVASIDLQ